MSTWCTTRVSRGGRGVLKLRPVCMPPHHAASWLIPSQRTLCLNPGAPETEPPTTSLSSIPCYLRASNPWISGGENPYTPVGILGNNRDSRFQRSWKNHQDCPEPVLTHSQSQLNPPFGPLAWHLTVLTVPAYHRGTILKKSAIFHPMPTSSIIFQNAPYALSLAMSGHGGGGA